MKHIKLFIASLLFVGASLTASQAAVTYVDATTSNSRLETEGALVLGKSYTTSKNLGSSNDYLWHLRTDLFTNGGDAWTAQASQATQEAPDRIVTTFTLPQAGKYHIYGYFWNARDGQYHWDVGFELGNAASKPGLYTKDSSKHLASLPEVANYFTDDSVKYGEDSPYDMLEAALGIWDTAVDGLTVTVYADGGLGMTGSDNRTRYDGIGYQAVP
ncbi:hypothetical protein ACWPKO_15120 [Coraliomargarita sp. W4R53]